MVLWQIANVIVTVLLFDILMRLFDTNSSNARPPQELKLPESIPVFSVVAS